MCVKYRNELTVRAASLATTSVFHFQLPTSSLLLRSPFNSPNSDGKSDGGSRVWLSLIGGIRTVGRINRTSSRLALLWLRKTGEKLDILAAPS